MKSNAPKFKVGDVVVVVMYGTVGTITKVHKIDKHFLYEVNHNEVLYFETSLQLYKDYDGVIVDTEKLDIEYQFLIGDVVYVKDYGKELFKITGHRTEIWRYVEDGWEDIIYELTRLKDGEWLETEEEDLTLVLRTYEMDQFVHQLLFVHYVGEAGQELDEPISEKVFLPFAGDPEEQEHERNMAVAVVDELLDIYNDYKVLYEMFQDAEYKEMMEFVLSSLKEYFK
ncbi:hypothetical protein QNH18_11600 [Bacillus paralicheniformis]|uniref:hypothetical protein n=1 Tax=Bacillus paralicheniformis TaxID=1648923 RepID=UPI0007414B1F|nr:hypothetical protein [Bacillus paralicheniformis]KUL19153.1 hypothetical protein LI6934_02870 [Bacillus licheniformis LMG 6934]MBG9881078.1 hypothetical protein [Bacillus paralicheniformis]MDE1392568.1 hypothetical protein [Bacillus paralicheniformis]MED0807529.1 hypothetical protein [Bacillus paralicheniformis]TWJ60664.1 hypothetical protein CHCC5023_0781 [Bacillus paralicheniformis]